MYTGPPIDKRTIGFSPLSLSFSRFQSMEKNLQGVEFPVLSTEALCPARQYETELQYVSIS